MSRAKFLRWHRLLDGSQTELDFFVHYTECPWEPSIGQPDGVTIDDVEITSCPGATEEELVRLRESLLKYFDAYGLDITQANSVE